MADVKEIYLSQFEKRERGAKRASKDWLQALRKSAIDRFGQLGFPTSRNEDWKYTNVGALASSPFEVAGRGEMSLQTAEWAERLPFAAQNRLVFVNGCYDASLSKLADLPVGWSVESLGAALSARSEELSAHLGRHASFADHSFVALNTALFDDGALVRIGAGTATDAPLHLVFVADGSRPMTLITPRVLILAERDSRSAVVETYLSSRRESGYFTNAVTEIALFEGASLTHTKLQEESPGATHLATLQVDQGRDTRFTSHFVSLGSALARNELRVVLGAQDAECTLNGFYLAQGRQHLDNTTFIEHAFPRCRSRELYKGILSDHASGVFSGRVLVRQDAIKTDASQTNQNLLLSDDASVDTKPQLAIYADDVKCTHGAAVGQLDEEAVFYLRSRGLDCATAKSLLTYAFASEMVEQIGPETVRAHVREKIISRLPNGEALREVA